MGAYGPPPHLDFHQQQECPASLASRRVWVRSVITDRFIYKGGAVELIERRKLHDIDLERTVMNDTHGYFTAHALTFGCDIKRQYDAISLLNTFGVSSFQDPFSSLSKSPNAGRL